MRMSWLLWIVFGALAGWIASMIMKRDSSMGAVANIVVGIVGAFLGGWIASLLGVGTLTGFNLYSLLIAIAGACLLLFVISLFQRRAKV